MKKLRIERDVAGTGDAHTYSVPAIIKSKRLLSWDATAPIERNRFYASRENHAGFQIEAARADLPEAVPVHRDRITVVVRGFDGCSGVAPHRIGASPLNVRRKLARGIHQADVLTSATDADHGKTSDDRHNRDRDDQLNCRESACVV